MSENTAKTPGEVFWEAHVAYLGGTAAWDKISARHRAAVEAGAQPVADLASATGRASVSAQYYQASGKLCHALTALRAIGDLAAESLGDSAGDAGDERTRLAAQLLAITSEAIAKATTPAGELSAGPGDAATVDGEPAPAWITAGPDGCGGQG
jgi:hypothetical protein